ncbi:MAG: TauD/TfdA family dioxygenase [Gammaproteobacteria bacterium]|nr:TauD/TfdA family dioxygenase [Gammaproteobacteria bacterium]
MPKTRQQTSTDTLRAFFLFFCKMLGIPFIQNNKNEYIYDVKYIPAEKNKLNVRGPQINDALPLHPDHGGLLGMYCLQSAENGGCTLLGNVKKIHDEIKMLSPELLKILYEPFYGDRRGQQPDGALPYDINPIFATVNNELLCQYVGFYYHDAQKKFHDVPKFTDKQMDALNLFHEVSNNKKFILEIKLNAGDVIFLNNNRVLHGRTKFEDSLNDTCCRHLLRVWLSTPKIKSFPHYYGYPMPNFE